jgi:hypothetical protein
MTQATDCATDDTIMPSLFAHTRRQDWGVGVLAWELGGKRGYLFEDGEERTLASGFYALMGRVEQPSPEQKAVSVRLHRMLAARARARHLATEAQGPTFYDQVARLHETYPAGLLDPKWVEEVRGEGVQSHSLRHRAALIREAREQLTAEGIDALIASQQYGQVWELIVSVLSHSDLVPKVQLKQTKPSHYEQQRDLASAARELLYGKGPYEQRFDRFVAALTAHSGEPAHWESATALSAIVHPTEHVCVQPTAFRKQLKTICSSGKPPAAKPTGAEYIRVLAIARAVAKKLAEQGEATRDLLDVIDFMCLTLKPVTKARAASAKPQPRVAESSVGAHKGRAPKVNSESVDQE